MKITRTEVTIHEKRNNPFAFGHYDCSVTLTAELGDEIPDDAIAELRDTARWHVEDECERWESSVRQEKTLADTRARITDSMQRLRWANSEDDIVCEVDVILKEVQTLPEDDREELVIQMNAAAETRRLRIENPNQDDYPF